MRNIMAVLIDLLLMFSATVLAFLLRQNLNVSWNQFFGLIPYLLVTLVVGACVSATFGASRSMWRYADSSEYIRLVLVSLITVVLTLILSFWINRLNNVSRSLPPLQLIMMSLLLVGARIWFRHLSVVKRKPTTRKVGAMGLVSDHRAGLELVLGLNTLTELYLQSLAELPGGESRIAGLLSADPGSIGRKIRAHTVLGTPVDIARLVRELENHGVVIDKIVVTEDIHTLSSDARAQLSEVELSNSIEVIHLRDVLMFGNGQSARSASVGAANADGSYLQIGEQQVGVALTRSYWAFKRAFDVIVSALLILILLPLFFVVALLVFVNVGNPILFWQRRPGRFGEPFKVIKFRTMRGTFDRKGSRIPEHLRLSPLGRILRSVRLDELPQLVHILRGDMSFIGPRPLLPVDQPPEMAARLMVRPGLTGWAQVHGGNLVTPADKAAMDLWYINNASLAVEAKIVVLTIKMLLFGQTQNADMVDIAWRGLEPSAGRRHVLGERQHVKALH